jgi:hypothetical protein
MALKRIITIIILLGIAAIVGAQTLPESKYKLSEIQLLRLQVRQKDALLAQQALSQAQANFQNAMSALTAEASKVKEENKWDAKVQFDAGTLQFSDPSLAKEKP